MKVLCLLASLCLPSLILSDFKEMSIICNHHEINHTDSRTWNISLDTCLTLQIDCTERENKTSSRTLCNSPVECGLEYTSKFVEKLLGNISCTHSSRSTSCKLLLLCSQTIFLCENEDCDLHHILTGNNNKECTFYHSITQCIKKRGEFQKDINCTMSPSVAKQDSLQLIDPRSKNSCAPTEDNLTAIRTTCPSTDTYCIATIVLGCILPLVVLSFSAYICWNCCHNNQGPPGTNTGKKKCQKANHVEEESML